MSKMLKALQRLEEAGKIEEPAADETGSDHSARATQVSAPQDSHTPDMPEPPGSIIDEVTQVRHMEQPAPGDYVPTPPGNVTQPLALPASPAAQSFVDPSIQQAGRNAAFTQPLGASPSFDPYQQSPLAAPQEPPAQNPAVEEPHPLEGLGNTLLRSLLEEEAGANATHPSQGESPHVDPQSSLVQTIPAVRQSSPLDESRGDEFTPYEKDKDEETSGREEASRDEVENPVASLEDRLDRLRESAGQLYAADAETAPSQTVVFDVDDVAAEYGGDIDLSQAPGLDTPEHLAASAEYLDLSSDSDAPASTEAEAAASSLPAESSGQPVVDHGQATADPQVEEAKAEPPVAGVDAVRSTVFYGPPPELETGSVRESSRTISDFISPKSGPPVSPPIVKPDDVLSHIQPDDTAGPSQIALDEPPEITQHEQPAPDAVRRSSPLHRMTTAPAAEAEAVLLKRLEDPVVATQFSQMVANLTACFPGEKCASIVLLGEFEISETSYVASAFAATAARELNQRVLLVDGNPGQAKISQWFEATQQNGFVECLNGNDWHSLVSPTSVAGLHLLPAGQGMITSYENAPEQFCRTMAELLDAYRFVIVDGGRLPEQLATILAAHADATLLVVELGRSQADRSTAAIDALRQQGARVLGAIATNAPPE